MVSAHTYLLTQIHCIVVRKTSLLQLYPGNNSNQKKSCSYKSIQKPGWKIIGEFYPHMIICEVLF